VEPLRKQVKINFLQQVFDIPDDNEPQATPFSRGRIEPALRRNQPSPVLPYPLQEQIDPVFLTDNPASTQVEDPWHLPVYLQLPSDTNYKYWIIHHTITTFIHQIECETRFLLEASGTREPLGVAELGQRLNRHFSQRYQELLDQWLPYEPVPLDPDYFDPGGSLEEEEDE